MKEIRVGIIGAGTSAQVFHCPFMAPPFFLQGFLRNTPTPVKGFESIFVTDQAHLFDQLEIDLVIITTPSHTHFELAKHYLRLKKHLVLEKPMAATFDECTQLEMLARENNLILAVYHNRFWDGDFMTVAELIENKLGRVVEFESHFDRFRNFMKPNAWRL